MRSHARCLVALGLVLVAPLAASRVARADLYRYTDDAGNHHIVNDPSQIPRRYRSQVRHEADRGRAPDPARTPAAPPGTAAGTATEPEAAPDSPPGTVGGGTLAIQTPPAIEGAPPAAPSAASPDAAAPPASAAAPAASAPAPPRYVLKSVDPTSDHVVLDVQLNRGVRQRVMVDTGATMTVIPLETAARLGLSLRPPFASMAFQTASGTEMFPVARLKSIEVGGAVVEDLAVVLNPKMSGQGLLGVDFLSSFNYAFEPDGQTLTLSVRDTQPRPGFYGGTSEAVWRRKFGEVKRNLKHLRGVRAGLVKQTSGMDKDVVVETGPFAGATLRDGFAVVDMSIDFWERELSTLERRADEADVPYDLR